MSDNVVQLLPNNALCMDVGCIASRLRTLADRIEAGEFGEIERIIALLDTPDGVQHRTYGRPTSNAELVGLMEYAKHGVLNPRED